MTADASLRRALTNGAGHLTADPLDILLKGILPATPEPEPVPASPRREALATRCIAGVESKPVSWLWPGHIPGAKLTIIAGPPGTGKSQLTASIAATVTTGRRWPVDGQEAERGGVLFANAEDDPGDTLRPRLEAAGADLSRVHVLDGVIEGYRGDGTTVIRPFSLSDVDQLEAKLAELQDIAVVIIDPVTAFMGSGIDSHKNSDVRGLLAPLATLAAKYNTAIICVSHLSKGGSPEALNRVSGSLAFVAAARAAFLVAKDAGDPGRRLFLPLKNNLGPDEGGLAFRIEAATVPSAAGPIGTSRVAWEPGKVDQTADDALSAASRPEERSAIVEAQEFLKEELAAGPQPSKFIEKRAEENGITRATIRRAATALGIVKTKTGMAGGWEWDLQRPKVLKSLEGAQESHVSNLSIFDADEHLRQGQNPASAVEVVI